VEDVFHGIDFIYIDVDLLERLVEVHVHEEEAHMICAFDSSSIPSW
jgi:hypothetical protein